MPLLTPQDWDGAEWLNASTPRNAMAGSQLRAVFALPEPKQQHQHQHHHQHQQRQHGAIRRAHLYVAGLAYYKCWLNGQPVSDHELGHFTTFERRVLYDTWSVGHLLNLPVVAGSKTRGGVPTNNHNDNNNNSSGGAKNNALACSLASGFFGGYRTGRAATGVKGLLAKLSVVYDDGTKVSDAMVTSASSAEWSFALGPYTTAGVFESVEYDAALETVGYVHVCVRACVRACVRVQMYLCRFTDD